MNSENPIKHIHQNRNISDQRCKTCAHKLNLEHEKITFVIYRK